MSSRNVRLTEEHKDAAKEIYKTLKYVKRNKYKKSSKALQEYAMTRMAKIEGFKPEYFILADGRKLTAIENVKDTDYAVACTAVWAGNVRLIDNIILKKPRKLDIFV